ncbi:MAG: SCP2 sterol-binding domain-containing protein [Rhodobacteraceae bacterium]|nr:SCP2 sterol-binding domain-containing protein [Paracoccaceae bacterium]MCW9044675.1 SCP2 sterol-binding domain-containing protein [Pseudopelagicola sp.]
MSDIVNTAVATLTEKLGSGGFDGSAKFVIEGEGAVMIDSDGVRAADDEAEVTLTADAETFQAILEGDTNPTAAFMSGKLAVDGDMGQAMQLGTVLS